METTTFILVPGFWLGGWAWDGVADRLREAGAGVDSLTLPGLESDPQARNEGATLDDQIAAVVEAVRRAAGRVVLVGHSGSGAVVTGAADAVPDVVDDLVFVDSGPVADGAVASPGLADDVEVLELPDWSQLEAGGSSLAGLEADARAEFRRRAVPHPAGAARQPISLHDERRRQIPVTLVCASMSAQQVRDMIGARHPWFEELGRYESVRLVDLPTGHWPMWSRTDDLADELLSIAPRSPSGH